MIHLLKVGLLAVMLVGMGGCAADEQEPTVTLPAKYWTCTKNHFEPIGMAVSWPCDQWTRVGVMP